jgi:hypothetical protein
VEATGNLVVNLPILKRRTYQAWVRLAWVLDEAFVE